MMDIAPAGFESLYWMLEYVWRWFAFAVVPA